MTNDVHPQITPNDFSKYPEDTKNQLSPEMFNVYSKIWSGAAATLSPAPILEVNMINIKFNDKLYLTSSAFTVAEEGWLRFDSTPIQSLREVSVEEYQNIQSSHLSPLMEISDFSLVSYETQQPQHFSISTLTDKMDESDIGTPSTYASSIQKIADSRFSNPYIIQTGDSISLSSKAHKALNYLDQLGENKVDALYTARLESNLDKIEYGEVKASVIIKDSLETLFPDIFCASSPTWIDELIGDDPEIKNPDTIVPTQAKNSNSLPLSLIDIQNNLSESHPMFKIKRFIDKELEVIFGKNTLNSTIHSKVRIIKAFIYQQILNIESLDRYMLELKYNFLLKWLIGLNPENEVWCSSYYKNCLLNVDYCEIAKNIIGRLLEKREISNILESLKINL